MKKLFTYVDWFTEKTSNYIQFLVLVMMLIVVISVVTRYFLKIGFIWALPINRQLWGVFILFAGSYTMLMNRHLNIEVLTSRLPFAIQFCLKILNLLIFISVLGIIIWQSSKVALNSVLLRELSQGTPKIPLYTIKTAIPLLCVVFLFQGIASLLRGFHEKESDEEGVD
ncbi:MAG: TRAP transporter small permease subunit [Firmicutes bacterium]|nr:TRAP transporter small permease subunit [Bacillota bacterium]